MEGFNFKLQKVLDIKLKNEDESKIKEVSKLIVEAVKISDKKTKASSVIIDKIS